MDLRAWRESKDLTLGDAGKMLGGISASTVFDIENGKIGCLSHRLIDQIFGATGGAVTAADHNAAWRRENHDASTVSRAAGRSAAADYRAAAKSKPRK